MSGPEEADEAEDPVSGEVPFPRKKKTAQMTNRTSVRTREIQAAGCPARAGRCSFSAGAEVISAFSFFLMFISISCMLMLR